MAQYRKKPVVIEASQWFKNGDHPLDGGEVFPVNSKFAGELVEGRVVRYYCRPDTPADRRCQHCCNEFSQHGWIDTKEGGHIVCPGDWIITGVKGEHYPCKPDIFEQTYEAIKQTANSGEYDVTGAAVKP